MECRNAIYPFHFNTVIIQSRNLSISIAPILYANRKSILGYIRKHDETSIDASTIVNRIDMDIVLSLNNVISRFLTIDPILLSNVHVDIVRLN